MSRNEVTARYCTSGENYSEKEETDNDGQPVKQSGGMKPKRKL